MSIERIRDYIREKASEFGAKQDQQFNRSYIERNNTGEDALKDNGAYFGLIHPEEETSGPYHDFSLTIFPNLNDKPWFVCLGVGSAGFKNDYELAMFPGLRRLFLKLVDENGFCKSDFSDIETGLPKDITSRDELQHIRNTIRTYTKVLPVCQIVDDPSSEKGQKIIAAFLAGYARLRDWPSNEGHRRAISAALAPFLDSKVSNDETEVSKLLVERKYVILQGSPGTGKTRLAKTVAERFNAKVFFTQFHAETSYSDFIYGIRPSVDSETLSYSERLGTFAEALKYAVETEENTILVIDEINRANLSNVLGPVFYLFEHKQDISNVEIEVAPELRVNKLPDNFFVISTMNTADRSLAVVDFALRRRFAWYSLRPRAIQSDHFFEKDFSKFQEIFDWYANSSELLLQPGQGYFLAQSKEEMENRIKYELYPLIQEYLQEGLLMNAKEEFNNYFKNRINLSLFE